ncbi:hypothetical protein ACGFWD_11635 [Streptomyces sp. NPDC048448]|uniref:hypothetical protein n=1 Tax=Streptomyces sp. NPDC048448 TaxID=3365554 RepID=UPI003717EAB8
MPRKPPYRKTSHPPRRSRRAARNAAAGALASPGLRASARRGRPSPGADPATLDRAAAAHEPASVLACPLVSPGERFPFLAPDAVPFVLGTPASDPDPWAARTARFDGPDAHLVGVLEERGRLPASVGAHARARLDLDTAGS